MRRSTASFVILLAPLSPAHPAKTFPSVPQQFTASWAHTEFRKGADTLKWEDTIAYDCDGSHRVRTPKETKTNMTITYVNGYATPPWAGNIQPFYGRFVCALFPSGGGDSCPIFKLPWFINGMERSFKFNGTLPCPLAPGSCDLWVYSGTFHFYFDAVSQLPVRMERYEGGELANVHTYMEWKLGPPPEWVFSRRSPADTATCIDFRDKGDSASDARAQPRGSAKVNDPDRVEATRAAIAASGLHWRAAPCPRFDAMTYADVTLQLDTAALPPSVALELIGWPRASPRTPAPPEDAMHDAATRDTPAFDSRTQWPGCIGVIQDQHGCGSCWAFGTTESLQDRLCIAGVANVSLSAQWLVSCESDQSGCGGGYVDNTGKFLVQNGTVTQECLPYSKQPSNVRCTQLCSDGSRPSKFFRAAGDSDAGIDEADIMAEIETRGPVPAAFYVFSDFMHYAGGVYARTAGTSLIGGHEIKILGWGEDPQEGKYWTVANSWGVGPSASHPGWGENGFFRIARGQDECGIEQRVAVIDAV